MKTDYTPNRRPAKKNKLEQIYNDFDLTADYTLQEAQDILAKLTSVRPVVPKVADMSRFSVRADTFMFALITTPCVVDVCAILDPKNEPGYSFIGLLYDCAPLLAHVKAWTFDFVSVRVDSVLAQCLVHRVCKNAPVELTIRTTLASKSYSPPCSICSLREGLSLAELPTTRRVDMSGVRLRGTVDLDPDRARRIASNYCLTEFRFPQIKGRAAGEYDEAYFFVHEEVEAIVERNIRQKQ